MNEAKKALKIARNLARVGEVNSVNETKGTVQVLFSDKDETVTDDLPMFSFEYDMPAVGDQVLCIFLGNGLERGFCLGSFYSQILPPPVQNKNIYYKKLEDGVYIRYNRETKVLELVNDQGDLKIESQKKISLQAESISINSTESLTIESKKGMSIKRNTNNPDADPEKVSWEPA